MPFGTAYFIPARSPPLASLAGRVDAGWILNPSDGRSFPSTPIRQMAGDAASTPAVFQAPLRFGAGGHSPASFQDAVQGQDQVSVPLPGGRHSTSARPPPGGPNPRARDYAQYSAAPPADVRRAGWEKTGIGLAKHGRCHDSVDGNGARINGDAARS